MIYGSLELHESLDLPLKTIGKYSYQAAMTLLDTTKTEIIVQGYKVKTNNPRYHLFRANKTCVWCTRYISTAYLVTGDRNKPGDRATFSFKTGDLLFTKDHIMPKKRGGPDAQWNYQTMCSRCNQEKGHGHPHTDRFAHPHTPYTEHEMTMELVMRDLFGC